MNEKDEKITLALTQSGSRNTRNSLTKLSEADLKYAIEFSERIDVSDTMMILQYGTNAQKHVMDFTDSNLYEIPKHDYSEISEDLKKLCTSVRNFEKDVRMADLSRTNPKAHSTFKTIYERSLRVMNETARRLEIHRSSLLRHMNRLDGYYDQCLTFVREYDMYIYAGQVCLQRSRSAALNELLERAQETGVQQDAMRARDYEQSCLRLERKLSDLSVSRQLPMQIAAQIRMIQNTDAVMAENLRALSANTFPLWKNRVVLASGLESADEKIIDIGLIQESDEMLLNSLEAMLKSLNSGIGDQKKGILNLGK